MYLVDDLICQGNAFNWDFLDDMCGDADQKFGMANHFKLKAEVIKENPAFNLYCRMDPNHKQRLLTYAHRLKTKK